MKNKFRSFEDARKFIHSLQLRGGKDWSKFCKSGKRPIDIPSHPHIVYKKDWISWGDWFGTGRVADQLKKFRTFEEARKFAISLKLKNKNQWADYVKRKNFPNDIPKGPRSVYLKKGWSGWGNFLGTGFISTNERTYRKFSEARKYVHSLSLNSGDEWTKFAKSKEKPVDIPATPENVYKKEWIEWGDWLGTGRTRNHRSFHEARKYVRTLGLTTYDDWWKFSKSVNRPSDIPATPEKVYKKEWKGMGDWLGTFTIPRKDRIYRPFIEARNFARSLNLKGDDDWKEFSKSVNRPSDIPSAPWEKYRNQGWKGMGDFLGTFTIASRNRVFKPFQEARNFAHSLKLEKQFEWKELCKSGKLPNDIPTNPWDTYKNKGWKSVGDWLGTGNVANQWRQYRSLAGMFSGIFPKRFAFFQSSSVFMPYSFTNLRFSSRASLNDKNGLSLSATLPVPNQSPIFFHPLFL